MEKINSWCKIIALISILSSVLLSVLPESKSKKVFKTLLSLVMIYAFVSPLANTEIDFSAVGDYFSGIASNESAERIEEYENYPIITASEGEIEKYFKDFLFSLGIDSECEAVCEYTEEKIIFKELRIWGVLSDEEKDILKKEVRKIGDENTVISFAGEEYEQ